MTSPKEHRCTVRGEGEFFVMMPRLWELGIADVHHVAVVYSLASHMYSGGGTITQAELMERIGIGKTKLNQVLQSLKEKGLVDWEKES